MPPTRERWSGRDTIENGVDGAGVIELQVKFRSRSSGSFGSGPIGIAAEWLTATWMRFTTFLASLTIVMATIAVNMPLQDKILVVVSAPIGGLMCWFLLLVFMLYSKSLGLLGRLFARTVVIYFFLFSRLVVQPPPMIEIELSR